MHARFVPPGDHANMSAGRALILPALALVGALVAAGFGYL